ncbi:hypothetical protein [Amycolatopsis circi]|uniref:hypothetical protein n=1 Tax=Amycolatopsis circi TaxID=871959 RepID=UPI0013BE9D8A|nr:hypothetical protein [Amycolatopsis circi]
MEVADARGGELRSDGTANNDEDGLAAEVGRNLWLCPACGALYIINWMVFPEDADGCDKCDPTVTGATTEAVALKLTGWDEERLLHEAYKVATDVARMWPAWGATPLVKEIERRLGMSPPVRGETRHEPRGNDPVSSRRRYRLSQPTREGEIYSSQEHLSVDQALDVFIEVAVPKTLIIDEATLRAEHWTLKQSWGNKMGLARGSVAQISDVLRRNLQRDATVARYDGHHVVVLDNGMCAQVYTSYRGIARAYRVWRTRDGLALCGGRKDTILDV